MTESSTSYRGAAICGFVAVALNLGAIIPLQAVPHTYKPGNVGLWLSESLAAPGATTVSAWAFSRASSQPDEAASSSSRKAIRGAWVAASPALRAVATPGVGAWR